jgi:hypothetical protein
MRASFTSAGLALAGFALLGTGVGVGYAAGQIGTAQIKKNGTLTAKDMVKEKKQKTATLLNGGQGDCVWQSADAIYPGIGLPKYHKDRFGRVHLVGLAFPADAAGGDADCDTGAEIEDGIAFILPKEFRPAKNMLIASSGALALIVGPAGLTVPGASLPPGAVYSTSAVLLDNVSYEAAGSKVVTAKVKASGKGSALKALPSS